MSQTTLDTNGPRPRPGASSPAGPERRQATTPETVSPEALIERHVDSARRQLADAREHLKAARRRVVQLEDALCNWERFADELHRGRGNHGAEALDPGRVR